MHVLFTNCWIIISCKNTACKLNCDGYIAGGGESGSEREGGGGRGGGGRGRDQSPVQANDQLIHGLLNMAYVAIFMQYSQQMAGHSYGHTYV